ncbi:fibrinogen-binding adhesin SdrG C-terminal domain-containing protein [Staphylococcus pseudintermedius]|nr:fibrinogen-binding adhesin SdrG C-terminal domain-containing protein [Staphylococcus pseudintermedius]MCE5650886.1 fibrinogen-binding adhesin SdrG C-terminal domain-containing protein [Staphylococcus pseudintermedius]MCE5666165.1 fibrinogen-binding adhesin SdrG C-terminal domain-containing protein [Staphylococcus pseudintermedius]
MITNKNIYSIRKHKLGVASFLLGTLFVVGHANNAEASEVSTTTQEQNAEKEQTKTEGELTTEAAQQTAVESIPASENMQERTLVASENGKEVTTTESTQEVTKTETKDIVTMKDSEIAQPVSHLDKPVTQTAPVQTPTTANKQTSPRQAQEDTAPMGMKEVNVENGTDVTSKVKVENSSITGHQNNDRTYRQPDTVNPHKAERVTLNYDWSFDKDIKNDDYFEFQLSDNVDTNGISTVKKVPNIVDTQNNDTVIAFGEINEQNRVRYRFTDYVNQKENLKGKLALNLFIKPDKVQTAGNITVSSKLGNQVTSQNFNIQYIDGVKNRSGVTLNGRIDTLSKTDQTFTHFATFKPNNNALTSVTITGKVKNGALQNGKAGEVKVYEFIGSGELPQSVYANVNDTKQFNDITNSMKSIKNNSNGYEITFDMNKDNHPYIIVYQGHFNNNAKDFDFSTNATGYQNLNQSEYSYYWPYNYSFNLTWDNGVAFYSNNASGEGNDKPVPPTYGYSPTVNTIQDTHADYPVMTFQQPGTLEETEDSMPITTLTESGEDRSENTSPIIETTEDSQPVEFEEETNHGIQDVTLHADAVDFEEETNHGDQDTVHHSDVVEYDEDTTTGMLTGAISNHTTEEDTMEYTTDGLLIEFDDEMNPNVSGQYDDITTDTIEESSHIDTFTELESEFGQHDGIVTFEEDTIVEKPKTEKGNRVPLVIDLSTPKHNHQFNIQPTDPNIDTSATYRIGDFVWRDEDHNGVQNDGEHGLEGVLVTLKTADGVVLNTTTSDANGHYQFTNVQKGKYIVEFTTPEGYEATSKHTTANTEKDSDGLIANIDVTQDDMSIDAGFFPLENWNPQPKDETYTIGDFVWRDEDHNGVQNDGEHGLEGVLVTLKTADGVVLNTTTSDANGHYQFTNVQKGKYIVEFTTPEGYEATSKHTTANTEKDSDGLIANIDVTQDDMSIDAGFFPLENWNPQPEPKNPDDKEKPAPEQPDVPQPEPKNPDDREKPAPEQPDVPQPEPKNPDDREKPAPEQPDVPQPEPKNPDDREKPAPEQPDVPQPEPKNPDDREKPAPEQPDVPQPEPKNPDDREKPAPEQPDVPQPEPKNPDDKEKPAPEQPDVPQPKPMLPGEKVKPKPTHPGEAMQTTPQDKSTSQTDEALPKTGESSSQSSALIFGGLLSLLGLGLLRRSSKQNRSSMK